MCLEDFLSNLDRYLASLLSGTQPSREAPSIIKSTATFPSKGTSLVRRGKMVAPPLAIPFWQRLGWKSVRTPKSGVRAWRGPLSTRFGSVIAQVESPHPNAYKVYILNLPMHLRDHPCFAPKGSRYAMHLHGKARSLSQVILEAEKELEKAWNRRS